MAMDRQRAANFGGGCLVLFSLPFLGMGLTFAYVSFRGMMTYDPRNTAGWVGVLFGGVFAAVGLAIMVAGFQSGRVAARQIAVEAAHPEQPWLWQADWAQGRANGGSVAASRTLWVFAIFWNAISWAIVLTVTRQNAPPKQAWAYLLLALFPAVGVGLLINAVVRTMRAVRYGRTFVQLQTLPAPLGRKLKGTIEVPLPHPLPHGINLFFRCVNRVTTGSGKNRSTYDYVKWQEQKNLASEQIAAGPTGSVVPVEFDIPRNVPPTDHSNHDNRMLWFLRAEADVPGVDFDEVYEIPVFLTHDSPTWSEWEESEAAQGRSHAPSQPARPTVVVSAAPEGGTQFYFPAGRNVGSALWLTFFTLIFGGVEYFLVTAGKAPIIFPIMFGLFTVLLLCIALKLWFGSARLVASGNGLTLHTNLLGYHGFKEWPSATIQSVYPKITMQESSGRNCNVYYSVTIRSGSGEYSVGNPLRDHNECEWICGQIGQIAHLQAQAAGAGS